MNHLFAGRSFSISKYLPVAEQSRIKTLLEDNGGTIFPSSQELDGKSIFISRDQEGGILPDWIDSCIKLGRFLDLKGYSSNPDLLFSGLVVACRDPQLFHDISTLSTGIESKGGSWSDDADEDIVTHVISTSQPPIASLSKTYILPHYFDDCFKLNIRLPQENYVFPDINILSPNYISDSLDLIKLEDNNENSSASQCSHFLNGHVVYIADDNFRNLQIKLESCGAKVIRQYSSEVTMALYSNSRTSSKEIASAANGNLYLGSEFWMIDMLKERMIINPSSRPLHFPWDMQSSNVLDGCVIAISNYGGANRKYLILMINSLGAQYTSTLSTYNTHLICSTPAGEKYSFALSNKMHIVNHLWLEESFSEGQKKCEGRGCYTTMNPELAGLVNHSCPASSAKFKKLNPSRPKSPPTPILHKSNGVKFMEAENQNGANVLDKMLPEDADFDAAQATPPMMATVQKRSGSPSLINNINCKKPMHIRNPIVIGFSNCSISGEMITELLQLGLKFDKNILNCSHLVAEKIVKSEKFLVGIARGIDVVRPSWLHEICKQGKVCDVAPFRLKDKTMESKLGFSLFDSITRARQSKLLEGMRFYATPNIKPNLEIVKRIIESSGGFIKPLPLQKDSGIICFSCLRDSDLAEKIKSLGYSVFVTEWLLNSILKQQLEPMEERYFLN